MPEDKNVELYEMPSCGDPRIKTEFNPILRDVNKMVEELEAEGIKVSRFSPSDNMVTFFKNVKVANMVRSEKMSILPITIINGDIIKVKEYPSIEEVRSAFSNDG